ncbi:MAG: bifunctional tetrahydrofolate synthase/dihydrofolate synthase [Methylophaga sp.]|nr:bifunctional tetrahydrofolate synthase/dihydrofolate synthase [Methylophaga sp.]
MRFNSLPQWLAWQEKLHFTEIDPGLTRISVVWQHLAVDKPLPFKIVTVAGTNGKGSSVALLTSILRAAGYKTGSYTSPHLLRYNERIAVNGEPASDLQICKAFAQIDAARQDISLTYFEFATLAAAIIFSEQQVDIAILEVGMGGRLDAVNLFDADLALITPISLDHMQWLGDNREKIGLEKAGILRSRRPLVCSEQQPPQSVLLAAENLDVPVFIADGDFHYQVMDNGWHWQSEYGQFTSLPMPALYGRYQLQNCAAVLMAVQLLAAQGMTNINETAIRDGLQQVKLGGRFQILPGPVQRIFDVTHNQQGAENLATVLSETPCQGKTLAVFAMLRDKDSVAVFKALGDSVDHWFLGGLNGERGQSADMLVSSLQIAMADATASTQETVEQAYHQAMQSAQAGDRLLIFGSFHTVEAVMRQIPELMADNLAASA